MKNLTLVIQGHEYDIDTHIIGIEGEEFDQVRVSGRLNLPMFDSEYNEIVTDILESRINEKGQIMGDFEWDGLKIVFAIDLTDEQRYNVITKG